MEKVEEVERVEEGEEVKEASMPDNCTHDTDAVGLRLPPRARFHGRGETEPSTGVRGAPVRRFEDLIAWQKAKELANAVYALCENDPLSRDFGLRDQLRRAAVSVMSNIAEGFERETTPDFLHFLYIAKGSAGEIRSQLYLARDRNLISEEAFLACSATARQNAMFLSRLIVALKEKLAKEAKERAQQKTLKHSKKTPPEADVDSFGMPTQQTASIPPLTPFPFTFSSDPFDL